MKTIEFGEPMEDPCKNCGLLYGYQVTDSCKRDFKNLVLNDEDYFRGQWSDYVKTTKEGNRAYCANCGHDLKLKVNR